MRDGYEMKDACFCLVQVGVAAPHDHVWNLHRHHEVGLDQSSTSLHRWR